MDLIYTDAEKKDIGVLQDCEFDLAFGADENDFLCTIDIGSPLCAENGFLYIEGTEYGGIIDQLQIDSESGTAGYYGRTWHGILASKVLCPDTGQDYLVLTGEANELLARLIERMELQGVYEAAGIDSGLWLSGYSMDRYIDAYSGIRKMLSSVGGKLKVIYNGQKAVLSAERIVDYSKDEEWDSSQIGIKIMRSMNPVNHVICLGKGDLADRQIVHLYADSDGEISRIPYFTAEKEVVEVYDYANAESLEELIEGGTEILKEAYRGAVKLEVSFDGTQEYDIGDIVGAREAITGIHVSRPVVKKIVKINKAGIDVEYKVGES